MPEYKTIEAKVKKVEGRSKSIFFEASKLSGRLEIELEKNDSPVKYLVMDNVFPIEKGDYVKVKIDVFLGYVSNPSLAVSCRDLNHAEKASIIEKWRNNEVVATYVGE